MSNAERWYSQHSASNCTLMEEFCVIQIHNILFPMIENINRKLV